MLERPVLPPQKDLTPLRVVDLTPESAAVEALDRGLKFSLPRELLPHEIAVGDRLNLKIMDPATAEASSAAFAQRLLEEIMN